MSVRSEFFDGTAPMLGVTPVPRYAPELPFLAIVISDSEDDELVAAMAEIDTVPAPGFRGDWGNVLEGGPDEPVTFKFRLRGEDGSLRAWTYPGPPKEMVDVITSGDHHVAVLPQELAGGLDEFDPHSLAGALIVEVEMDPELCEILRYKSGYDY